MYPLVRGRMPMIRAAAVALATAVSIAGCHREEAPGGTPHAAEEIEASAAAGVIEVPASVRGNLGITFAKVERRRVADTVRLPGRFESTPEAHAEYRASSQGLVTLVARQYQRVQPGEVLYRIDSEAWRLVQARLLEAELAAELLPAQQQAADRAAESAQRAIELQRARQEGLAELLKQGASQVADVADAASAMAEAEEWLGSALERQQVLVVEALALRDPVMGNRRFAIALREAATLVGRDEAWLLEAIEGQPRWRTLRAIEVTARKSGVVAMVEPTDGAFLQPGDLVMETVDPDSVRFRGFGLQADIGLIGDGDRVAIVPPHGGIASYSEAIDATLVLGVEADPDERTFDLIATPTSAPLPAWARPGVAAFVEVIVAGSEEPELALPLESVVSDGLERVFFLRDRDDPDRVRRVVADLGADDGRWVVVNSGVRPGDEVVVAGVYELKLTGSGKQQQGGHFHADGTFHAGEH